MTVTQRDIEELIGESFTQMGMWTDEWSDRHIEREKNAAVKDFREFLRTERAKAWRRGHDDGMYDGYRDLAHDEQSPNPYEREES